MTRFFVAVFERYCQDKEPPLLSENRIVQIPIEPVRHDVFQRDFRLLFEEMYHQRGPSNFEVLKPEYDLISYAERLAL